MSNADHGSTIQSSFSSEHIIYYDHILVIMISDGNCHAATDHRSASCLHSCPSRTPRTQARRTRRHPHLAMLHQREPRWIAPSVASGTALLARRACTPACTERHARSASLWHALALAFVARTRVHTCVHVHVLQFAVGVVSAATGLATVDALLIEKLQHPPLPPCL